MRHHFFYVSLLFVSLASCNQSGNKNQELQQEILAAHDSIMPKMGEFVRDGLKINILSNKMDSLKTHFPDLDTLKEKETLLSLQAKLQQANDAMTDWMHEFEPDQEGKQPEEVTKYLKGELEKVRQLNELFSSAEKDREQVLTKYK